MKVLLVYAHHDPKSFSNAMLQSALRVLEKEGHETKVSDLHAQMFKAVANEDDFEGLEPLGAGGASSDYQSRQILATESGLKYTKDIRDEFDKLEWSDGVIFIFPYYWSFAPAILKGYFDRVFVPGIHYGKRHATLGLYGNGGLVGKRALIGVTFGVPEPPEGAGVTRQYERIEAIQVGVLAFVGFDVVAPSLVYGVREATPDRRKAYLEEWKQRVRGIFTDAPQVFAQDGPTPQPKALLGRARRPGERVMPYGNDRAVPSFLVIEKFPVKPGRAGEVLLLLEKIVQENSNNDSVPIHTILRSPQNPDEVWAIVAYESEDSFKHHMSSDLIKSRGPQITELLAGELEVTPLVPHLSKGI